MRMRNWIIVLGLLPVLLITNTFPVSADPPPMPSSFFGTVKMNDKNVPLNTVVSAWINGVQYADTKVSMYSGDTVYSLNVPGDIDGTPGIEGGRPGDVIVFMIGNQSADQTGTWQSGTSVELDLSSDLIPPPGGKNLVFLPCIIN